MKKSIIWLSLIVVLVSCASITKDVQLRSPGVAEAEILLYRESAFLGIAEGLYFGEDGKSIVALGVNEYIKVKIDAGEHTFEAKAHASPASKLNVVLEQGTLTCIKGAINASTAAAVAIPIITYMVNHFKLEVVQCPSEEFFKEYRPVTYP